MDDNSLHWFVIYTRSHFEKKVADNLCELEFEIYLPLIKTLRQWSDRKKKMEVPLFRSYLFIHTTLKKLKSLLLPVGALKIVTFEGKPAIVPDTQIQNLKILLNTDEKFDIIESCFTPGDYVEVTTGPMRGIKGTFVDYSGKKYILIQIDALKQNIIVTINPIFIRKLKTEKVV
jgi:transcription antitermination factor NusG